MPRNASGPANTTDPASFADVVRDHWQPAYRFLYRMTGHLQDSEDLTQEVFLRAMNRFGDFQQGTNLRAWLLRIATNAFLDMHRKRQRLQQRALPEELPDKAQRLGLKLEQAEEIEQVNAALQELSETARAVFHLRVQEELSFAEIATMLETSEEAARWHMHQARTKLMKQLQGEP